MTWTMVEKENASFYHLNCLKWILLIYHGNNVKHVYNFLWNSSDWVWLIDSDESLIFRNYYIFKKFRSYYSTPQIRSGREDNIQKSCSNALSLSSMILNFECFYIHFMQYILKRLNLNMNIIKQRAQRHFTWVLRFSFFLLAISTCIECNWIRYIIKCTNQTMPLLMNFLYQSFTGSVISYIKLLQFFFNLRLLWILLEWCLLSELAWPTTKLNVFFAWLLRFWELFVITIWKHLRSNFYIW